MQPAWADAVTLLFVPASRPERVGKALASGAGGVIVDLEDAVAPAHKADARAQCGAALATLNAAQRARTLVRINAEATHWHRDDVAHAAQWVVAGLGGVVVPKAESADGLAEIARALGPRGHLLPLIESAAGLHAADGVAQAPQVVRLGFGHLDFQADAGLACEPDEVELTSVRLALVLTSRRADLAAPLDGVTVDLSDEARVRSDAARARRLGFGGKLCIHPAQVAPVHEAFRPGAAERDWAERVLAQAAAHAGAVFRLDGRMVDEPVIRLARRTLAFDRAARPPGETGEPG